MIKREVSVFLVVGLLTVLIDFVTYRFLIWGEISNINWSKAIGFIIGTVFSYFANRSWTFGQRDHKPGSVARFIMIYALALVVNVFVNSWALSAISSINFSVQIAFVFATGISAFLNFFGMHFFVFRERDKVAK